MLNGTQAAFTLSPIERLTQNSIFKILLRKQLPLINNTVFNILNLQDYLLLETNHIYE